MLGLRLLVLGWWWHRAGLGSTPTGCLLNGFHQGFFFSSQAIQKVFELYLLARQLIVFCRQALKCRQRSICGSSSTTTITRRCGLGLLLVLAPSLLCHVVRLFVVYQSLIMLALIMCPFLVRSSQKDCYYSFVAIAHHRHRSLFWWLRHRGSWIVVSLLVALSRSSAEE